MRKESGKHVEKRTMDRLFEATFLVIFPSVTWIDGGKVLKLLFGVWKEVIFKKAKDCTNEFESYLVIVWAIDVDDAICEGCKRPVEEHLLLGWYTLIVPSSSQVIVDHLK